MNRANNQIATKPLSYYVLFLLIIASLLSLTAWYTIPGTYKARQTFNFFHAQSTTENAQTQHNNTIDTELQRQKDSMKKIIDQGYHSLANEIKLDINQKLYTITATYSYDGNPKRRQLFNQWVKTYIHQQSNNNTDHTSQQNIDPKSNPSYAPIDNDLKAFRKEIETQEALSKAKASEMVLETKHRDATKKLSQLTQQLSIQDMNRNLVYRQYLKNDVMFSLPYVPEIAIAELTPLEKKTIIDSLVAIESNITFKNKPSALISFSGRQNHAETSQEALRKWVKELTEILIHREIPLRWAQYQDHLRFESAQTISLLSNLEKAQSKNRNRLYALRKRYQAAREVNLFQNKSHTITPLILPKPIFSNDISSELNATSIVKYPTNQHFISWSCIIAAFFGSTLFLLLNTTSKPITYTTTTPKNATTSQYSPKQHAPLLERQQADEPIIYNVNAPSGEFDALLPLVKRINRLKTTPTPAIIHLVSLTDESIAPRFITSLAIALAQNKQRVLIAECDKNQRLATEIFFANEEPGACSWLASSQPLSNYLIATQLEYIQFLPLGISPPDAHNDKLLMSSHQQDSITPQFDTILTVAPHSSNLENSACQANWTSQLDGGSETWLISDNDMRGVHIAPTPYDCIVHTIYS